MGVDHGTVFSLYDTDRDEHNTRENGRNSFSKIDYYFFFSIHNDFVERLRIRLDIIS